MTNKVNSSMTIVVIKQKYENIKIIESSVN